MDLIKQNKFVFLDGAMGTLLQNSGLKLGECPEVLSITNGETVMDIHRQYIQAGSDIIYANTFGANSLKLKESGYTVEQVIFASVQVAKKACEGTKTKVALDIGPIGEMMQPTGTLGFDTAYNIFKEMVTIGEKAGADLVVFETMTDLYEVKAGVLATKENTKLPVFVSMTFEQNGRTFTGCEIKSMAVTLQGLGVDALGINCSLGPVEILPLAKILVENTTLPVFVKPNAGLPNLVSNSYDVTPQTFATQILEFAQIGVSMVGGCCGTSPEYIQQVVKVLKDTPVTARNVELESSVCTPSRYVKIDGVKIIGERINPTGKKLFKKALVEGDINYVLKQAIQQVEYGANILDVNVGIPDIDEASTMVNVIEQIQAITDTPLQIDSTNADVIAKALRIYNGKAIVNSVTGDIAVLDKILPIVKKYGAAVVGLTLDEGGIPELAQDRFIIAKRIMEKALEYGIPKHDIYIDCLTLTASAQQKEVMETLKAVRMVKEQLGLKTVLGVSNISFGLPNRELLNHSFLLLAMSAGLDLPIINPNVESMLDAVRTYNVLTNTDVNSAEYIKAYRNQTATAKIVTVTAETLVQEGSQPKLVLAIKQGLKQETILETQQLLKTELPLNIVNNYLIPTLDEVGLGFENGTVFLPQLLQTAMVAGFAFDEVKKEIAKTDTAEVSDGVIVLATVKGDVHDIGKNIAKVILENYGYNIIDLGKDVAVDTIIKTLKETGAKVLGLSALMTTTLKSMQETIKAVRDENIECKIMVGGAVLTEEYAIKIGADFYARDAKKGVDFVKNIF